MFQIQINGIDAVIRRLENYANNLETKKRTFLERLAEIGVSVADTTFRSAEYDGDNDVKVAPQEWIDDNTIAVQASGTTVLFIEFGSGLIGYGHEWGEGLGYVPGSWSDSEMGKGHWADPNGWYYKHGEKSHGNPPARAMYEASKEMRRQMLDIAREVFAND